MEVDALNRLQQSHDWVDLGRHFNPAPEKFFTWWSYRNIDWRLSDRGRRLDHIWASPSVAKQATGFEAIRDARDWGKPSDHIPQIVTLDL
jgi:exodeoxyribonuclease-3